MLVKRLLLLAALVLPNAYADTPTARSVQATIINPTSSPVPISRPTSYTTGTITALNGTVNLTVAEGQSNWDVYYSGTFSAGTTLQFQGSLDNINWFQLNGRRSGDALTNDTTTSLSTDVAGGSPPLGGNPSNWRGSLAGLRYFRVLATSFVAGDNISIQISTSIATGAVFLNAAIPSGNNTLGSIKVQDGSGNVLTSQGSGTKQLLDVSNTPMASGVYYLPVNIVHSGATASGSSVFAMRNNPSATKTLYVENILLQMSQPTTSSSTTLTYIISRFSVATPSGGTALTAIKGLSTDAASQLIDARVSATGTALTVTGVTFESNFYALSLPVNQFAYNAIVTTQSLQKAFALAPGEGLAIRLATAAQSGLSLSGGITWTER